MAKSNCEQFRRQDFKTEHLGAYVTVFQHPKRFPMLDINFFNGDKTGPQALTLAKILTEALELAAKWEKETLVNE